MVTVDAQSELSAELGGVCGDDRPQEQNSSNLGPYVAEYIFHSTRSSMNIDIVDSDDDIPPALVEAGSYVGAKGGEDEASPARRVPITIVTGTVNQNLPPCSQPKSNSLTETSIDFHVFSPSLGYLGAGKSTLLNYILSAQHGKKIAVILNGLYFPSPSSVHPLGSVLTARLISRIR